MREKARQRYGMILVSIHATEKFFLPSIKKKKKEMGLMEIFVGLWRVTGGRKSSRWDSWKAVGKWRKERKLERERERSQEGFGVLLMGSYVLE